MTTTVDHPRPSTKMDQARFKFDSLTEPLVIDEDTLEYLMVWNGDNPSCDHITKEINLHEFAISGGTQSGCDHDGKKHHVEILKQRRSTSTTATDETYDLAIPSSTPLLVGEDEEQDKQPSSVSTSDAIFILLIFGAIERCCFYGVLSTQTSFLEGVYNETWSPDVDTQATLEFTSLTETLVFTYPFLGAILADSFLGNYWTIIIGSVFFYLPGFLLIALVAKPYLLSQTFPMGAMTVAYLFLYAFGAGLIKPCVNIMGAQQFDSVNSVHLKSEIQKFYVSAYMCNNIGAVIGGMVIPTVVETINPFAGYMISTVVFTLGICVLAFSSGRFIKMASKGNDNRRVIAITVQAICGLQGLERQKESKGGPYPDALVRSVKQLASIVPVTTLTVPFNIVYCQMRTTFAAQGNVMAPVAFVDSAWMQNFESFAVILAGIFVKGWLYPHFEKRNGTVMRLSTKFAIGTAFGTLSMFSAIIIDLKIVKEFNKSGQAINIFWQVPSFVFMGFGEIFAISASYEAAFLIGPKNLKALTSAVNLFLSGGVPPYILNRLFWLCSHWFEDPDGNMKLNTLHSYAQSHTINFFALVLGVTVIAVLINLMPAVDRFLTRSIAETSGGEINEDTAVVSAGAIKQHNNFPAIDN